MLHHDDILTPSITHEYFMSSPQNFADMFNATLFRGQQPVLPDELHPPQLVTHLETELLEPIIRSALNDFLQEWVEGSLCYLWKHGSTPMHLCLTEAAVMDDVTLRRAALFRVLQAMGQLSDSELERKVAEGEDLLACTQAGGRRIIHVRLLLLCDQGSRLVLAGR